MRSPLAAPTLFLLLLPSLAAAQRDTTARLQGTVTSSINGTPLAGVMIAVPAAPAFVVTDSTGTFRLDGLPTGLQRVRIAYLGRETEEYEFQLRPGKTKKLEVLLDVEAVDLAPIVVTAQSLRSRNSLAGFYERKRRGWGRFITREQLDRDRPFRLSQLLWQYGFTYSCAGGSCGPVRYSRGRLCRAAVIVDNMRLPGDWIDVIHPDEVAGIEVYRSGMEQPLDFQVGGAGCGAVVIWTRSD